MDEFNSSKEYCKKYYSNVISRNEGNINNIKTVISNKYIYINHTKIKINKPINDYLNLIINELKNTNNNLSSIEITIPEKYRQDMSRNKGKDIINIINGNYVLYDNIYHLFPLKNQETDIIFTKGKSLGNYLLSLADFTGGEKETIEINYDLPFYNIIPVNYQDHLLELTMESTSQAIRYSIYHNLKKLNNNSDNENKREAENLYNILFNYYNFTGNSITDVRFIKPIIEEYNKTYLKYMTLDDYVEIFRTWYNRVKEEDKDNDYDSFEDTFHYYGKNENLPTKTRKRQMNNKIAKKYNRRNNTKKVKTTSVK